jgi:HAD superfamily hydrolase (TIGR01509 family)
VIRAFVFDFDGLIVDTESALVTAYADIHARHGRPFDRELFLRSVGHAEYDFDPWHAFEKRADRAVLETERQKRNRELNNHLPILPGVVALLHEARAAGLRLGVASNSGHPHVEGQLGRLGLAPYFEFFACREDAPSPKPAPDLYQLVLTRFGLSGPQAVAFEDSHTGATAAKRAGLWTVAVPNISTAHHDFSPADLLVASLAEVKLPDLMVRFGGTPTTGSPA